MDPCGHCLGPDCRGYAGYRDPNCPVHGILAHAEELKKRHVWQVEEVDGGSIGVGEFWYCPRCAASGGPAWYDKGGIQKKTSDWYFYADGSGLQLTADCAESAALVQQHFQRKVQEFVAEGFNRELAGKMEVAVSTVNRWANGTAKPLPRMMGVIIGEMRKILEKQGPR